MGWFEIVNMPSVTGCRVFVPIPKDAKAQTVPMRVAAAQPAKETVLAEVSYIASVAVLHPSFSGERSGLNVLSTRVPFGQRLALHQERCHIESVLQ